jgi:hypothetical protein
MGWSAKKESRKIASRENMESNAGVQKSRLKEINFSLMALRIFAR